MIYFMQAVDGGPVKIGTTEDLETRHCHLERYYNRPLAILATMEGGREREAEIHARFAHLRFGRTEQFRPAPELMAFIDRPLLVGANPAAVEVMLAELKAVRLELPPDIHRELRIEAAKRDVSMAALARIFVEAGLGKRNRGAK